MSAFLCIHQKVSYLTKNTLKSKTIDSMYVAMLGHVNKQDSLASMDHHKALQLDKQ